MRSGELTAPNQINGAYNEIISHLPHLTHTHLRGYIICKLSKH